MVDIAEATSADRAGINSLVRLLHGPDATPMRPVRQAARTFVARSNGEVAGFALATLVDYGVSRTGMLEELAVAEAAQGTGIGRELVDAGAAWLAAEGIEVMFVSVLAGAEGFYAALDFKPCTGPWLYRVLAAA